MVSGPATSRESFLHVRRRLRLLVAVVDEDVDEVSPPPRRRELAPLPNDMRENQTDVIRRERREPAQKYEEIQGTAHLHHLRHDLSCDGTNAIRRRDLVRDFD